MTTHPRTLAETYFRAWKDQDFDSLRSVLADNATFTGPWARPVTPRSASPVCGGCRG